MNLKQVTIAAILATILFYSIALCVCHAADWSNDEIANAIYFAEGGAATRHPYGILKKYKTTTPRQACINTIKHARRDWNGKGDFIEFLGSRYCPVGAANDPTGLNKNWVKNVKRILEKRKGEGKDEILP